MERNILIELSDNELKLIDKKELEEIEKSAMEFDGFTGMRIVGQVEPFIIKKNAEYIICAAIYFDNKKKSHEHQPNNIDTGYVICGHRHHNCIMTMSILDPHNKSERMERPVQGFLTNTNRFVDREEGFEIALEAEQILMNKDRTIKRLFSEDIY